MCKLLQIQSLDLSDYLRITARWLITAKIPACYAWSYVSTVALIFAQRCQTSNLLSLNCLVFWPKQLPRLPHNLLSATGMFTVSYSAYLYKLCKLLQCKIISLLSLCHCVILCQLLARYFFAISVTGAINSRLIDLCGLIVWARGLPSGAVQYVLYACLGIFICHTCIILYVYTLDNLLSTTSYFWYICSSAADAVYSG